MKRLIKYLVIVMVFSVMVCGAEESRGKKEKRRKPHIVEIEGSKEDHAAASHVEVESICDAGEVKCEELRNFCIGKEGQILVCDAGAKVIKVVSEEGKLVSQWKLPFAPYTIDYDSKAGVYVAGEGVVARLKDGKVVKVLNAETAGFPDGKASGIAIMGDEVFVAFGFGWSLRSLSSIVRFDKELSESKVIAEELRGCCQRLDMVARDGKVYVAENARHRVVVMDREGKVLKKWGERDRTNIEGFGSCCNPMNLSFGKDGELYTAESGLGRVKRYTTDGKFLGLVGYVGTARFVQAGRLAASCSNITVAVNKDGSRIYVLDYDRDIIRVLKTKEKSGTEGDK